MLRPIAFASVALAATFSIVRCTTTPSALASATPSEYCAAAVSYARACGIADPCTLAADKECETLAAGYSAAARGALTTCLDGITCGDAGAVAAAACAEYWLAAIPATDAQAKLAQDYCAACPSASQTKAQCVAGFYATVDDGGLVIVPGAGYPVLPRSDGVVARADTECVPELLDAGSLGCLDFGACALQAIEAGTPPLPAACTGDSTGDTSPDAD